jgi:chitinase
MGAMIDKVEFDILLVQFYNTPECSARRFVDSDEGFTYDELLRTLAGSASTNAKIYLGLPADEESGNRLHYLTDREVEKLVHGNANKPNFGGIMLWDANSAAKNTRHGGRPYYQVAKDALNKFAAGSAPIREAAQVTSPKDMPVVTSSAKVRTSPQVLTGHRSPRCPALAGVRHLSCLLLRSPLPRI